MSIKTYSTIDTFLSNNNIQVHDSPALIELENNLNGDIQSSYTNNNYFKFFYNFTRHIKPKKISELGVLGCYSILSMASALNAIHSEASLTGYDLFEDYEFNSFSLNDAKKRVAKYNLTKAISFQKRDIFMNNFFLEVIDDSDLIHIDLSNDGATYKQFIQSSDLNNRFLIFEGGSIERDNVEWMKKYNKKPINPYLKTISDYFEIHMILAFPSITIVTQKSGFK